MHQPNFYLILSVILFYSYTQTLSAQSPGDFVITEFMSNPQDVNDSEGEYIEIFNTTGMTIDIDGCRVRDVSSGGSPGAVSGILEVPKGGLVVFGKSLVPNRDVVINDAGGFTLNNDTDEIIFECPDGMGGFTTIASLSYSFSNPIPNGESYELNLVTNNNNGVTDQSNYLASTTDLNYDNDGNLDKGSPGTAGASDLPISLLSFEGQEKEGKILLLWKTSQEINNDFMAVERSEDGRDFREIGRIKGVGNSTVVQAYQFLDRRPISGTNYYRLRQVDFDGTTAYHQMIAVQLESRVEPEDIQLFPTVASQEVQISFPVKTKRVIPYTIFNLSGQAVIKGVLPGDQISSILSVNRLSPGAYFLQLMVDGPTKNLKFIKK